MSNVSCKTRSKQVRLQTKSATRQHHVQDLGSKTSQRTPMIHSSFSLKFLELNYLQYEDMKRVSWKLERSDFKPEVWNSRVACGLNEYVYKTRNSSMNSIKESSTSWTWWNYFGLTIRPRFLKFIIQTKIEISEQEFLIFSNNFRFLIFVFGFLNGGQWVTIFPTLAILNVKKILRSKNKYFLPIYFNSTQKSEILRVPLLNDSKNPSRL